MKALAVVTCLAAVTSAAILIKFAQVGLEFQGAAQEASANPLKALFSLFRSKPAA